MGEAVASREQGMATEVEEMREQRDTKKNESYSSPDVVRWGRIVPRMGLRVLLVEADDSTRQIIAALLRKCSYRVAAVPDGLKAWETLKGRPHNIDLIVTEVELPSISGYALLTLIMEHDICKNIPVIMMSSQDSISLVFKCMLKGAADFLIKPVRRNELRNLWQHVWRRQIQSIGHVTEKRAVEQQKAEVTSEKNAASNSSDCLDYTPKNTECSEKGSDSQSSCTTPCLEAEGAYMQNMHGLSQLKQGNVSNLINTGKHKECVKLAEKSILHKNAVGGLKAKLHGEHTNDNKEGLCLADDLSQPSSGVLDLIGKFESCRKDTCGDLNADNDAKNFVSTPELELSLRRLQSSHSKTAVTNERHLLNHSNASAFSWYNNGKASRLVVPTLMSNSIELKDGATIPQNELINHSHRNSVLTQLHGTSSTWFTGQSGSSKIALAGPQLEFIPVSSLKFDSSLTGYGQIFPPIFHTQPGFSSDWSSRCQQELSPILVSPTLQSSSEIFPSEQGHSQYEETTYVSDGLTAQEDNNMEAVDIVRHSSPTPELSGTDSLHDGIANKLKNDTSQITCDGSDVSATPGATTVGPSASESVNDNHLIVRGGLKGTDSHYSSQREAALVKFRLKRKDRCYEKRVRYQSRKRLAEQRPRVKGQFVRQVPADVPQTESWSADG